MRKTALRKEQPMMAETRINIREAAKNTDTMKKVDN